MNIIQQFEAEQITRLTATRPVPVFQPGDTLDEVAVTPLAHGLRVDLEPVRSCFDRPVLIDHHQHHPMPTRRCQRRVRMLRSSVRHEPLLALRVSCGRPTASQGGLTSTADQEPHPAKDKVPVHHN